MKFKGLFATGLVSMMLFGFCSQVGATANVAIDKAPMAEQISSAVMIEYSRPPIDILRLSLPEAKEVGYYFDAKKDFINLKQYCGTAGLMKFPSNHNTKLSMTDVVPFGLIVDYNDWERFKSTVLSVDVDNCLDCALYEKTKDPYKLKDHLVSLRAFTSMVSTLNVRNNYALKQSAYDRLMKNDKGFASSREKAKEKGFKLCSVVPDDYPGLTLNSYVNKVQTHMNSVEEKMKAALQ